jgi:hypothetical protein
MENQEQALMEIVSPIIGNRRKFVLLRIADMSVDSALEVCGVKKKTYYSWLADDAVFAPIYRQRDMLSGTHKQEAIRLLRRENQLSAVLLEGQIIQKIQEEIISGEYQMIKTPLAKEVYTKLISNLDYEPKVHLEDNRSWENSPLYQQLLVNQQPQITGGINAGNIEADNIQTGECQESNTSTEDEQSSVSTEKKD